MTPKDILHAEFPEQALEDLHRALSALPHATHALWGLSYWLKDQGDQTGSRMAAEWAQEFAEHEARRLAKLAQYARPVARQVAPVRAPARRQAASLNLGSCSLGEFAAKVTEAARSVTSGRWHGAVFISHIWDELTSGGDAGITYDRFKRRLMEAYQADLLELSRADLVDTMPAADVAASELTHAGARFHFVRL